MAFDIAIANGTVVDGTGSAVQAGGEEVAMRDLVNVEAIPFEVLKAGITWD